ncbi:Protein ABIL1 [Hibiscus syriacus]|uniref:Protein ABIL1 n=1 Tax=Hibiscus syriacus TaxID=106335 RepID=A0A6A3B2F2_HIBSY|nr:Protein ABIL1 [Hibiscus syriacus]
MAFLFPPSGKRSKVELSRPDDPAMTFDEVSMEHSKSFVKALQELKNLRPQLYAAAKYYEKSFHHTEMNQIVLDNLKDYAAKALVNTVDHLDTVAHKLTDLLEQKTLQVSTMELKASCLNQQLLIYQTYSDKEGLGEQQVLAFIPRHHKHYSLPDCVNKKLLSIQHVQTNPRQKYVLAKSLLQPSDAPASKPLSWHLASDANSTLKGTSQTLASNKNHRNPGQCFYTFPVIGYACYTSSSYFHHYTRALDDKTCIVTVILAENGDSRNKNSSATAFLHPCQHWELEGSVPSTAFGLKSFHNQMRENISAPVRGKTAVSSFFVKQKAKLKALHIFHEHGSPLQKGNEGHRRY